MAGVTPEDVAEFAAWAFDAFGYDFRDYHVEPLRRGLESVLRVQALERVSALQDRLVEQPELFAAVLGRLTVTASTMFRNPHVFRTLVERVFPYLRTFPTFKIWHAGCARGEEVYSLAILLHENGLLDRARIYATDINGIALAAAREGIYPVRRVREFTRNYLAAGGGGSLASYLEIRHGHAKISPEIAARVLFSRHNLVTDACFGEMQIVLCRNVLIYFNQRLQERAHALFRESLCAGGYLCVGTSESLTVRGGRQDFETYDRPALIYRVV